MTKSCSRGCKKWQTRTTTPRMKGKAAESVALSKSGGALESQLHLAEQVR